MLQVQKDLPNEGLFTVRENLTANPIPIVQRINLADESISPGLREEVLTADERTVLEAIFKAMAREELRHNISRFPGRLAQALEQVAGEKEKQDVTASLVRKMLREMAATLSEPALKEKYLSPEASDRTLLEVLRYVSSEERLNFLLSLTESSYINDAVRQFVRGKLDNALYFTSTSERIFLIEHLLANTKNGCVVDDITNVLKASKTLEQLTEIVQVIGPERLLGIPDDISSESKAGLREMTALAQLSWQLRQASIPTLLAENAAEQEVERALQAVEAGLSERQAIIHSFPEFLETRVSQDYQDTVAYELEYLNKQRAEVKSLDELRKLTNLMIQKIELEFKYGIKLTHEDPGPVLSIRNGKLEISLSAGAHWTIEQLGDLKAALEKMPEGILLITPLLKEIQRVESLGQYVLGCRTHGGLIQIADFAIDNPIMAKINPGIPTIVQTLIHEMGHSLQLGAEQADVLHEGNEYRLAPGDSRYEFAEFMQLSGWKLIHPNRFSVTNSGLSVKLDGQEYILGVPIKHNGQRLILALNQGLLFSYEAFAPFSLVKYSRTNPWEDWAEAFAEYFLMPERLITFAPEKFQYLEEEFRQYDTREDLQSMLARALAGNKE